MNRFITTLLLALLIIAAAYADQMIVTRTGERDGFDAYQIEVTRGQAVTTHNVTVPELRQEIRHQELILQWVLAELVLREFEGDRTAVTTLNTQVEATSKGIADLTYALDVLAP